MPPPAQPPASVAGGLPRRDGSGGLYASGVRQKRAAHTWNARLSVGTMSLTVAHEAENLTMDLNKDIWSMSCTCDGKGAGAGEQYGVR